MSNNMAQMPSNMAHLLLYPRMDKSLRLKAEEVPMYNDSAPMAFAFVLNSASLNTMVSLHSLSPPMGTVAIGNSWDGGKDGWIADSGSIRVYSYDETMESPQWKEVGGIIEGEEKQIRLGFDVALSADGSILAAFAANPSVIKRHLSVYNLFINSQVLQIHEVGKDR